MGNERYYEKFWDCPSCGTRKISALRYMSCPSCGASKVGQNQEKYSFEEITDAEGIELARGGPNWVCAYCNLVNLAKNKNCTGCGNAQSTSDNKHFKVKELGTSMPIHKEHIVT